MQFKNLNPQNKEEFALITVFKDCGVEPEDEVTIIGNQFMITSSEMYGAMLAGTIEESPIHKNKSVVLVNVPVSLNGDPFLAVVESNGEYAVFTD